MNLTTGDESNHGERGEIIYVNLLVLPVVDYVLDAAVGGETAIDRHHYSGYECCRG